MSCGVLSRGRRPAPRLCTSLPFTGCLHGSGRRLPRSPMQTGQARTSGLRVPPLLQVRLVGWIAPVRPGSGMQFVLPCPSAVLVAQVCGVSMARWRLFTSARAQRFLVCAVFYQFALGCFVPGRAGTSSLRVPPLLLAHGSLEERGRVPCTNSSCSLDGASRACRTVADRRSPLVHYFWTGRPGTLLCARL